MQTSKKSLGNKPRVVYIYGMVSVGKLSTAQELEKLTRYKLIHNHLIINPVTEIFPRGGKTPSRAIFVHELFKLAAKLSVQDKQSIIMTHAFSYDFVDQSGLRDVDFIKRVKSITENNGGVFCPIFLYAEKEEIIKRSNSEFRAKHKKLIDREQVKNLLNTYEFDKEIKFNNNLKIDNTNLSPKKVGQMIKKHFNL